MKWSFELPDYEPDRGISASWEDTAHVVVRVMGDEFPNGIAIEANEAGFVALARLFLSLADPNVLSGNHWHLDTFINTPVDIVIEKR